jgi:hypothetical protein
MRPALTIALVLASASGACGKDSTSDVHIEDVVETPARYAHHPVSVLATVDAVESDTVLVVRDDALLSPKRIVVQLRRPAPFAIAEGQRVRFIGRFDPHADAAALLRKTPHERVTLSPLLTARRAELVDAHPLASQGYQQRGIIGAVRLVSKLAPSVFVGHAIDLDNVPVVSADERGIHVGFAPHFVLFVACGHAERCHAVSVGDRVALHGTIRAAGESHDDRVYIEAETLTKLTHRPST